jgi:nucleoside-diphosphate-sugar epimerase
MAEITDAAGPSGAGASTGRVVVTGAAGTLGRAVVTHLRASGWDVLSTDRIRPVAAEGEFVVADLSDYAQALEVLTDGVDEHVARVDAVVHLAAIPAPGLVPNSATFANNATVTWNVFNAARAAGIRNVVWASSETVLGLPFDTPPPYVPVDEAYRVRPESTYSLVKALEEEMAHHLCRWDPRLKMIGLRFSNVMEPEDYAEFPGFDADPALRRWNLWGYIDARDGAQAVRRALEHPATGPDVFIVANADTVMSRSSADLVAECYPGVEVRKELGEHETLLSIDKARRVLGFAPEHSWRDTRPIAPPA